MYSGGVLDQLPLWGLFLATIAVIFGSVEGGYRLGRLRRERTEPEKESSVGAMVAATLGLVAFTLAFTFGLAATRFETRREVILEEANAIGTTYLRAALLPEPQRSEARRLLREYVDVRLKGIQPDRVQQAISESTALQTRVWEQAVAAAEKDPRSVPTGLFIQSLNEMIDVHSKRVMVGLRNRLPGALWGALYLMAILGMAEVGYHEGLSSPRRSPAALTLVLTFSVLMYLIADLDRPQKGLLRVSQQAMIDLRQSLEGTTP
jgi:hypothetical protein